MIYLYHAFYVWKAMAVDMLASSPQDIAAIACNEDTRPAVLTAWTGIWTFLQKLIFIHINVNVN